MRFRRGRAQRLTYGTNCVEFALADAADGEQVVDAAEWAALGAKVDDGLRSGRADPRKLLQFLGRGGIKVERLRRRFLLALCARHTDERRKKQ